MRSPVSMEGKMTSVDMKSSFGGPMLRGPSTCQAGFSGAFPQVIQLVQQVPSRDVVNLDMRALRLCCSGNL